jgi:hypothetical protein
MRSHREEDMDKIQLRALMVSIILSNAPQITIQQAIEKAEEIISAVVEHRNKK